jgi:sec-independent protein translocase protein TatA
MGDLFSGGHLILIIFVILLLFGGKKIPELMRGLGRGVREFKDAKDNVKSQLEEHINSDRPAIQDQSTTVTPPTQTTVTVKKEDVPGS